MRTNYAPVPNSILFINNDIQRKRERLKQHLGRTNDYYDHDNDQYGDHTNCYEHINTAWKDYVEHQDHNDNHKL